MAKKSLVMRQLKREVFVEKYKSERGKLKKIIADPNSSSEEQWNAMLALQKLPRNSSPVRLRNRCFVTGRPRGVMSRFGVCRHKVREMIMRGEVPGVTKSSW